MDQQFNQAIDFKEMYQKAKQRMSLEAKPIKRMLLYNYLNDGISTLIIDCRIKPSDKLLSSQPLDSKYIIKESSRLVLIISDTDDLALSKQLSDLREYIKNEDKITNGIFTIKESDYNYFITNHKYYLTEKGLYERKLPLCVINDKLYLGNFINSKNKVNLGLLGIKSVVSLMADEDKDFVEFFGEHYRNFKHEEANHDEVDFNSIVEFIVNEIGALDNNKAPLLVYCFSGQSGSVAVCAAYIMITKKWSLEFSIGYMMKLSPQIKIPSWLFSQLQRLKLKDSNKDKSNKK